MPVRGTPLVSGEYYHVYNRGIAQQPFFLNRNHYKEALLGISYYRFITPPLRLSQFKKLPLEQRDYLWRELLRKNERLVDIICFCFMPNHFHFLLKQEVEGGISKFIGRFTNSYTRFFNTPDNRKGPLLQGVFKAVHVSTTEQFLHLSRYIHLNPVVSCVIEEKGLFSYPWSSLPQYVGEKVFVNSEPVLSSFSSKEDYNNFLLDQIDYGKRLEEIKHLVLE